MTLEIVLPLGKKKDVKDLIFTILTKEYPLKLIELSNIIRKRYGRLVTFQAVRKAAIQLKEDGVLIKDDKQFFISKDWVKESKRVIDNLYEELNKEKIINQTESIGGELSVFKFNSLNEMMKFWQDLIDNWFKNFKHGDYHINFYQAAHVWEGLLHLDREEKLMSQLKQKRIKSHILSIGNTKLDRNIKKFYEDIGVKFCQEPLVKHQWHALNTYTN